MKNLEDLKTKLIEEEILLAIQEKITLSRDKYLLQFYKSPKSHKREEKMNTITRECVRVLIDNNTVISPSMWIEKERYKFEFRESIFKSYNPEDSTRNALEVLYEKMFRKHHNTTKEIIDGCMKLSIHHSTQKLFLSKTGDTIQLGWKIKPKI